MTINGEVKSNSSLQVPRNALRCATKNADTHAVQKWGFGMSPISQKMRDRYDLAVQSMFDFVSGHKSYQDTSVHSVSELKGMFSRCLRQDQWDWFTVHTEFGFPPDKSMRKIVHGLSSLRKAISNEIDTEIERSKQSLIESNLVHYLVTYRHGLLIDNGGAKSGWLYVLSKRETPDILKIGQTTRSVSSRVKEINSATGILTPWAVRRVFRVRNAVLAEKHVHRKLAGHRIRSDREFFKINFRDAVQVIGECLETEGLALRHNTNFLSSTKKGVKEN